MIARLFGGRTGPLYVILFTTAISITLIGTRGCRNKGSFLQFVESDRASISLVVQVVSSVLGLMQIYVATSLFNFATRIWISQRSVSLGNLNLWMALSGPKADLDLPWAGCIVAAIFAALAQAPGALWAGALTPVLTSVSVDGGLINTPTFTASTRNIWDSEFELKDNDVWNYVTNCTSSNDGLGLVSSCPVPDLQGALLTSAASSSTPAGVTRNHSKNDNPAWSYKGRSYGVASSQGTTSLHGSLLGKIPTTYTYTDVGYLAEAHCIKNLSSNFSIQYESLSDGNYASVANWELQGLLPNSVPNNPEYYPSITWYSDTNLTTGPHILGWAAVSNPNASERNMLAIAAGAPYAPLNLTQCSLAFTPRAFSVAVNVTEQSILVTPLNELSPPEDIEPTGHLTSDVVWSLNLLSRMTDSLYTSILGDTLQRNIQTVRLRTNVTDFNDDDPILSGISDSLVALMDDILVAFGSAQIVLSDSSVATPVIAQLPAIKIGQNFYIFTTAAINIALMGLVVIEALRTGRWRDLPAFDYTDVKAVIVAASANNGEIVEEVEKRHNAVDTVWRGEGRDRLVDGIRVCVAHREDGAIEFQIVEKEENKEDCCEEVIEEGTERSKRWTS